MSAKLSRNLSMRSQADDKTHTADSVGEQSPNIPCYYHRGFFTFWTDGICQECITVCLLATKLLFVYDSREERIWWHSCTRWTVAKRWSVTKRDADVSGEFFPIEREKGYFALVIQFFLYLSGRGSQHPSILVLEKSYKAVPKAGSIQSPISFFKLTFSIGWPNLVRVRLRTTTCVYHWHATVVASDLLFNRKALDLYSLRET